MPLWLVGGLGGRLGDPSACWPCCFCMPSFVRCPLHAPPPFAHARTRNPTPPCVLPSPPRRSPPQLSCLLLSDVEALRAQGKRWLGVQEARGVAGDWLPTRPVIGFVTSGSGVTAGVGFVRAEAVKALTHRGFCPFACRPSGLAFYALVRSPTALHYRVVVVRVFA